MSGYFEWNPAIYGLDVPAMDQEHRVLIGLMNKLHSLHDAGAARAELTLAINELVRFTGTHFADEEAHMAKIGYAGLRTHATIHKNLLAKIGEYVARFRATGALADDFFSFLNMWLKAHICGIDRKYATREAAA